MYKRNRESGGNQGGLMLAREEKSHIFKHCGNRGLNRDNFGHSRGRGCSSGKSRDGKERV